MAKRATTRSADEQDGSGLFIRSGIVKAEIAALLAVNLYRAFDKLAFGQRWGRGQGAAHEDEDA